MDAFYIRIIRILCASGLRHRDNQLSHDVLHPQIITERRTEQRSRKEALVILLVGVIGTTAPTRLGSTRWPYAFFEFCEIT